jgi:hypothetical protein
LSYLWLFVVTFLPLEFKAVSLLLHTLNCFDNSIVKNEEDMQFENKGSFKKKYTL